MTELDTVCRAKMYLDKLAKGVDPITDQEMPDDAVLKQIRLSRCFTYISGLLQKIIVNGGEVGRKYQTDNRLPFSATADEIAKIPVADVSMTILHFCKHISAAVGHTDQRMLSPKIVTDWLLNNGFLRVEQAGEKTRRRATDKGLALGLYEEKREGQYGLYIAVFYNTTAQQFILDNLAGVLEASRPWETVQTNDGDQ